jgi:hypothetical protein
MKVNISYMNIFNKLIDYKERLKDFILVRLFLLSGNKRQNYLINKNACMFIGLQNVAKHWGDEGDVRAQLDISSDSYKYLDNFIMYCDAKGIDRFKRLKLYRS